MIYPELHRDLPEPLMGLDEVALDLRWNWSHATDPLWKMLDEDAWESTRNPYLILLTVSRERLARAAKNEEITGCLKQLLERRRQQLESPSWFEQCHGRSALKHIAYFSMEFGLGEALPIYSGGLGLLAGDHLKTASDLGLPLVGIGLLYQQGYFRQMLGSDGSQLDAFPYNDPVSLPITPVPDKEIGGWLRIQLPLPGRSVCLRAWKARVGRIALYLLDSNDPLNSLWDRSITANLYPQESEQRLLQEIVLGVCGFRLLRRLGIAAQICHINEGHAALAVIGRALCFMEENGGNLESALWATRRGNIFTTHTPLAAAFHRYDPILIERYVENVSSAVHLPAREVLALGRARPEDPSEPFTPAYLALRGCAFVNGVSRLHGEVSRTIFQSFFPRWPHSEVPVASITNGVHVSSWHSTHVERFWRRIPADPAKRKFEEQWQLQVPEDNGELWRARGMARKQLIEYVRRRLVLQVKQKGGSEQTIRAAGHVLDPDTLTLGLARRFAEYKRPDLILRDPDRLHRLLSNPSRPVQLVVAGKAHPNDQVGKEMVKRFAGFAAQERYQHVVFVEDYDIELARHLVAGVDVWINTPRRPWEACGTSGMKILVNGGLNLSTLDGWWAKAYEDGVGWALGDGATHGPEHDAADAEQLYSILEQEVVPCFYDRTQSGIPEGWLQRVRASMATLTEQFNSTRMVREYVDTAYLPAAEHHENRKSPQSAKKLSEWSKRIGAGWNHLRFGSLRVRTLAAVRQFMVEAFLGEIRADDVELQLYAEPLIAEELPEIVRMVKQGPVPGSTNGFLYLGETRLDRPETDYTARIIPSYPDVAVPLEQQQILWQK